MCVMVLINLCGCWLGEARRPVVYFYCANCVVSRPPLCLGPRPPPLRVRTQEQEAVKTNTPLPQTPLQRRPQYRHHRHALVASGSSPWATSSTSCVCVGCCPWCCPENQRA
ncbi:hypothetical protein Hamer_G020122 [Homarus americanus]|uniref:Secreted protein n=1 Tax=Homarus americanus TaxID=6706 RepID=A0A8J5N3U9_HOMAM|nr:hypothetical protein Hamer_G020122 [Homarus americanus]